MKLLKRGIKLLIISLMITAQTLLPITDIAAVVEKKEESSQRSEEIGSQPQEMMAGRPDRGGALEGEPKEFQEPEYVPGELIVKLKEGKALEDIKELNTKYEVASQDKVFKDIPTP